MLPSTKDMTSFGESFYFRPKKANKYDPSIRVQQLKLKYAMSDGSDNDQNPLNDDAFFGPKQPKTGILNHGDGTPQRRNLDPDEAFFKMSPKIDKKTM